MIKNYSERFSKIELNNQGKLLAFIDNNILGDLNKIIQTNKNIDVINIFRQKKITPVFNNFIFYEFIKGLNNELKKTKPIVTLIDNRMMDLYKEKISLMNTLNDISLWILDPVHILEYEMMHLCKKTKKPAVEYYPLFSETPLGANGGLGITYEADDYFTHSFTPYLKGEPCSRINGAENICLTFSEYLEDLIDDVCFKTTEKIDDRELQKYKEIMDKLYDKKYSSLPSTSLESIRERIKKILRNRVSEKDFININYNLFKFNEENRLYAPFYFIMDYFPHYPSLLLASCRKS